VITCPACSKQNQDHYRFCLGCGAELPRGAAAAASSGAAPAVAPFDDEATHIGMVPSTPVVTPAPPPPEPTEPAVEVAGLPPGKCAECGYVNPPTNRFCASCGYRLDQPAAKPKAAAVEVDSSAVVLVALDPEGNEVGRHMLPSGQSPIGRSAGGVFAGDSFLSPEHATFVVEGSKVRVRDNGSLNGVFRKLLAEQKAELVSGQRFRIGQELLQFDALDPADPDDHGVSFQGGSIDGYVGRISLVVGRETAQPSFPVPGRGINMGRERGDVLFPEDGYVSGLHCHVSFEKGRVYVTDLGSSNGTFVQLFKETELRNGDVLLMGQQLFRVTC
jgi:pSer/pThr/pTyr-binding forkhead associated (FHA) protein